MLIGILALFMFCYSKHKIVAVVVAAISAVIIYFAVMNIEPLYNVLGQRLESLFANLFGEDVSE